MKKRIVLLMMFLLVFAGCTEENNRQPVDVDGDGDMDFVSWYNDMLGRRHMITWINDGKGNFEKKYDFEIAREKE